MWKCEALEKIYFNSLHLTTAEIIKTVESRDLEPRISWIIIQQIVTMPIYGKEALNICHPYMTDILRYT